MRQKKTLFHNARQTMGYLKDHRFSSILLKYFLLLFLCLVLPVVGLSSWYGRETRENTRREIFKRNEASLLQAYSSVNAAILSVRNLAYSLSTGSSVQYLASRPSVGSDTTGNLDSVINMLAIVGTASDYIDSIYLYFPNSGEIITGAGMAGYEGFKDKEVFDAFSRDMPARTVMMPRIKNHQYPYLLTVLYPIRLSRNSSNVGMTAINIDVEKLGDYMGSGKYRNTAYAPRLLILDKDMEVLVYSDEYRLLQEAEKQATLEELASLREAGDWQEGFSTVCSLWGQNFVVSGISGEEDGFKYVYLAGMEEFDAQARAEDSRLRGITVLVTLLCLLLAWLLAVWVYRPIQKTFRILQDMSMMTEWDKKEHVDEMEAIQRSILLAKQEKDDLNQQIRERIVSLHNAQICALQTQINPHFLFNTLEAIGNAAALLMNGDNQVTEMIYTLGKMMRISLSNENYLVPLSEELEHVRQYVKLVEFRFHGRVTLHQEIPEEMGSERIVKLTLQPLIENAIQHGLSRMRSGGEIWLKGEKRGEDNYLYVSDNGQGVTQEELEALSGRLGTSAITGSRHIGMRNVDQRLKLVFGEEYGLCLEHAREGGLRIIVHFKTI